MACTVHEDYVRRRLKEGLAPPDDRSMRQWDQLDDDLIDSNRQFADHIPVKVRALGYHIAAHGSGDPGALVPKLEADEVILLGKMEHQRWVAERRLAGWTLGRRTSRTEPRPISFRGKKCQRTFESTILT